MFSLHHRLEHVRAADRLGHLQVHAAVTEHRPVDPGHGRQQLAVGGAVADVNHRDDQLHAARAQAGDLVARRRHRVARLDARRLERGGVVGRRRRGHAEHADLDARGVDDPVGLEQALAVPAVEVRRHQRDARLLGELPQQRQADRQVALARKQRGRARPPERRREQPRAPLDLAGVGPLAVAEVSGLGQKQIAGVEHQCRVRFGARAIDDGRAPADPAQRMHRAAALLVVAVQVRRIQQRELLAPRRRRRGRRGGGGGRWRRAGRALALAGPPASRRRDDREAQQRRGPDASRVLHRPTLAENAHAVHA